MANRAVSIPQLASPSDTLLLRPGVVCATLAGLMAAGIYAASPMTVIYIVTMAALLRWAVLGLEGPERRWVTGLLSLALAIRVLMLAALFLYAWRHDFDVMSFFYDERYGKQRSLWMRDTWVGVPISPVMFGYAWEVYGWSGYYYVLAYLQVLFGPMPYGAHLFSSIMSFATSISLYRLARRSYGALPAFVGLALLLFIPSLLMWSVATLKEPFSLFLSTMAVVGGVTIVRARTWWHRVLAIALLVVACQAAGAIRIGAFGATAGGIALGLLLAFASQRAWRAVMTAAIVAVLAVGMWRQPALHAIYADQLEQASRRHMGNVMTVGYAYKLLDDRFYAQGYASLLTMNTPETLRYFARAFISFFTVPLPWQAISKPAVALMPQQMLWYVLVLLLPLGVVEGLRRDSVLTSMLVGFSVANIVVIALASGNVGTLVRHRDLAVPYLLWISALGAVSAISRLAVRTRIHASH